MLAAPAIVRAQVQNGVALVIGNSKYQWEASLPNVRRDAPDVARRFQALGLKTEVLENVGREAMGRALEKFGEAARGAHFAAFYFAGHGVYWEKQSYVVPVDADLADPAAAKRLIQIPSIGAAMKQSQSRLLVFDSCRNNPADGWRQKEAKVAARADAIDNAAAAAHEPNTMVIFSTAPGGIALDGPAGEHSPFAAAFIRQLDRPSVDVQALGTNLRRELLLATECHQLVWDQNTFAAPFVLNGAGKTAAGAPRHDPARVLELPNAYAYASQNGLSLPHGLVAYRAATGSADADKIGSFKHQFMARVGAAAGRHPAPGMFIVLAAAGGSTAEVVVTAKDWETAGGNRWRLVTAEKSARSITFNSVDDSVSFEMKWTDQKSGSCHAGPGPRFYGGQFRHQHMPFTRLDG